MKREEIKIYIAKYFNKKTFKEVYGRDIEKQILIDALDLVNDERDKGEWLLSWFFLGKICPDVIMNLRPEKIWVPAISRGIDIIILKNDKVHLVETKTGATKKGLVEGLIDDRVKFENGGYRKRVNVNIKQLENVKKYHGKHVKQFEKLIDELSKNKKQVYSDSELMLMALLYDSCEVIDELDIGINSTDSRIIFDFSGTQLTYDDMVSIMREVIEDEYGS